MTRIGVRPAAEVAAAAAGVRNQRVETEEAEEDSDDWKATMYYWRGELSFDGGKKMLTWKGAWVGSTRGLPSDQEFAASPNAFTLTSAKIKGGVSLSATAAELEPAAGLKSKFTGSYQLDQGDGLETFSDKTHMFKISAAPDGSVLVAARGTTEFGAFVSAGRLGPLRRGGCGFRRRRASVLTPRLPSRGFRHGRRVVVPSPGNIRLRILIARG